MTHLSLRSNGLTGPIPVELGNLANLTDLRLGYNGLTGPIPVELGNLANLTWLDLANSGLTGPIPVELVAGPLGGRVVRRPPPVAARADATSARFAVIGSSGTRQLRVFPAFIGSFRRFISPSTAVSIAAAGARPSTAKSSASLTISALQRRA